MYYYGLCACSVVYDFLWPPWTVAWQASNEFSRQEYWSGPSPWESFLPMSLISPALASRLFTSQVTREALTYYYAAAKLLQSCLTLYDLINGNPPGSPILGILQARILEWVAISFSNAWKWKVKVKVAQSCPTLIVTPWTAAHQAPPSMGFSRQEYWSGVPLPSPTYYYRTRKYKIK